ncbi:MAG: hypothetical protein KC931_10645 [Candidatus Omnitrophica bacterium]|nr:hypothetical protein [Candidatus Omnitrophota bacterium]MCA9417803.1 hypothetical protein [Candidatus Omnitrophota bacterium]MCA9433038.1 hypothetical protein [Candidatus Omnitrophota bacterium]MCA9436885.1 hypothetical protein [Candidatus Omnitrophota bacterium]MCA9439396.1 hypothetical protein [Candidatus Omnitrophota bacterium]
MKKLVAVAGIVLFLLHQDFWNWNNRDLWFGFLPAGLGYHAIYSLLAASLWALASYFAWPYEIEEFGETGQLPTEGGSDRS